MDRGLVVAGICEGVTGPRTNRLLLWYRTQFTCFGSSAILNFYIGCIYRTLRISISFQMLLFRIDDGLYQSTFYSDFVWHHDNNKRCYFFKYTQHLQVDQKRQPTA